MDRDVPLVVPEINPEQVRNRPKGIIANANCTTLAMIVAIAPLHREYGLRELVLASYQAVSGAGQVGVDTLLRPARPRSPATARSARARATSGRRSATTSARSRRRWRSTWCRGPARCADGGWSSEELKMRNESRKILGLPDLKVSATCVRVPVVTGHSVAVHAVFGTEVDAEGAREVLRNAPGVILVDDPAAGEFPMPIDAVGTDPSWVGRIRRSLDDPRALDLFVTGDNLRKGAALNTAQIAELLAAELATSSCSRPARFAERSPPTARERQSPAAAVGWSVRRSAASGRHAPGVSGGSEAAGVSRAERGADSAIQRVGLRRGRRA